MPIQRAEHRASDGQTFEDIEAYGVERWLDELAQELGSETYRPAPGPAGVHTEGPTGRAQARPLGIPTMRDRVAADGGGAGARSRSSRPTCQPEQYAYRPDRSALDAVSAGASAGSVRGHTEVVDADLSGLLRQHSARRADEVVARRVSDRRVLHLIKMWLEGAVEETDERGRQDTHDRGQGTATRQPARLSDLAAAGESLHAPVRAGVEEVRATRALALGSSTTRTTS